MNDALLTEEALVKAMTVNEELLSLGYTLSPGDAVALAKSADLDGLPVRIREYAGEKELSLIDNNFFME